HRLALRWRIDRARRTCPGHGCAHVSEHQWLSVVAVGVERRPGAGISVGWSRDRLTPAGEPHRLVAVRRRCRQRRGRTERAICALHASDRPRRAAWRRVDGLGRELELGPRVWTTRLLAAAIPGRASALGALATSSMA